MAQKNIINISSYTQGSAARQLEPMPSRLPKDTSRRPKQKLVPPKKPSRLFPAAVSVAVAALAIMAAVSLGGLFSARGENAALRQQLQSVAAEFDQLQQQADALINHDSVELYAKAHRMVKADAVQTIHINVAQ